MYVYMYIYCTTTEIWKDEICEEDSYKKKRIEEKNPFFPPNSVTSYFNNDDT
jgi:hypothetical protein